MNRKAQAAERNDGPALPGFALVVTISVLVLLAVIAVGLLTLSTITVRSGSSGYANAEARANAKLALVLAIGELQKELGPDQRISARAGILDSQPETPEIDGVARPNYLGVWDSWNTWLTDRQDGLAIQDTYKPGRDPSLFRSWLVSNRNATTLQAATEEPSSGDPVFLVREGSAGEDATKHVEVDRIPVSGSRSTGGRYAWWVSDEAQKARLNLEERPDPTTPEHASTLASHTGRLGIETMTDMEDFDTSPEALPRMITTGQARISAPKATEHFHDLTASSLGLLTDVRSGGFKSDLNLAFEAQDLPEEMDEVELFSGRPFDAPIRPMTGALADIRPQNPYIAPMAWRHLREYYRVYREFSRGSNMYPVTWERGKPTSQRFVMGARSMQNKWDTAGYARLPVMLRQTWIIATKTEANPAVDGGREYYILAIPIVSLWNPYDLELKVDSEEISYFGSMFYAAAMAQRTYRGSTYLGERPFPDESTWGGGGRTPNHDISANQLGYRMIPTAGRSDITFQPGEVRIFSTNDEILHGVRLIDSADAMTSRHFFATPGYEPVQDSGRGVLRGLKNRVNPGNGEGDLSFSLRLAVSTRVRDPFWVGASRKSTIVFSFQEALAAERGAYYDDGNLVRKQEWHDVVRLQSFSLDWLTTSEVNEGWIVKDSRSGRARFPAPGSSPMPIGIFSVVAKSPEQLVYQGRGNYTNDFRNRGWLHAPVTGMGAFLMNPTDLNRADSAYQLHFAPVNGDQEVSQWLQADGSNGYFGGGFTPGTGQTHVTALNLPVKPIVNLGSFAGARMAPARARIDQRNDNNRNPGVDSSALPGRGYHNLKHQAHNGGSFGAGIGNAYAHPMIEPAEVYTRNDFGDDNGWDGSNATKLPITDDYWDHLFLANEGLWDSWFCSGIAPEVERGSVRTSTKAVAEDFFSNEETHVSRHFQPHLGGRSPEELAILAEESAAPSGENGWDKIAAHILNRGQFNANSISKDAWKALLMSLADRPLALNEPGGGMSIISPDPDAVSIVRHPLSNSDGEATGPDDPDSWQGGIRKLTEAEVDQLAGEIVRQVKLRGPFLNMADFINRRLTDDATGVTGALQAAIDWDEFNSGYDGGTSGTGASINAAYKGSDAMLSRLPASYPNGKAATGSRYAGAPGYVMQADLLQGLGTSLSVRGDTFLIRAYGESLDANGEVVAQAWCEATLQRMPDYVDPADDADKNFRDPGELPGGEPDLAEINKRFGRKFEVVAFRWLQKDEV